MLTAKADIATSPPSLSSESSLLASIEKNLPLHIIIENEIRLCPYGQHTYNVVIKNGVALVDTINIVKQRRRRYKSWHFLDEYVKLVSIAGNIVVMFRHN